MITIIVAYDKNYGIGKNGTLPWYLPEDLKHFKETTLNKTVIMGRKTWDSIPDKFKPLPKRKNIVVTRNKEFFYENITVCHSLEESLCDDCFIIGGAQIYQYALTNNLVDCVIATEINKKYDVDSYFPKINWNRTILKKHPNFNIVKYLKG